MGPTLTAYACQGLTCYVKRLDGVSVQFRLKLCRFKKVTICCEVCFKLGFIRAFTAFKQLQSERDIKESDGSLGFFSDHTAEDIYTHTCGLRCFHSNRSFCQEKDAEMKLLTYFLIFLAFLCCLCPQWQPLFPSDLIHSLFFFLRGTHTSNAESFLLHISNSSS